MVSVEDTRVMSNAHAEKKSLCWTRRMEGGVGDVPLGLTHECLAANGKGSGCLKGMKRAPHLNV